ncbi:hypothetical protein Tco_0260157 [Tanacetum coccineum]
MASLSLYKLIRSAPDGCLECGTEGLLGIIDLMRQKNKRMKQEGLNRQIGILQKMEFDYKLMIGKLQDSHGALDLGSTRHCSRYCSKVLLLFESTAHYAQSTARCESTAVMFEGTASFIREGKIIMARIWRFIEEVIMKKIEYCLFDVVVEFHREMITSQLQGKLRLYDEVRARTLFVLSSSNRGRLLGIIDLMRQKNKRMKQEGLNDWEVTRCNLMMDLMIVENTDFSNESLITKSSRVPKHSNPWSSCLKQGLIKQMWCSVVAVWSVHGLSLEALSQNKEVKD